MLSHSPYNVVLVLVARFVRVVQVRSESDWGKEDVDVEILVAPDGLILIENLI